MNSLKHWLMVGLMAGAWMTTGLAQDMMDGPGGDRPGPGMRGMRGGGEEAGFQDILRDPEMVKALALDDQQIEKIKALNTQSKKDMIDWNAKVQHAALGLADLMGQEEPNEEAVLKAMDESNKIRNEMAKLRVKHLFAVRALLTPEQRQKARELLKVKMSERRKAGEGKGGKGGERGVRPPPPPSEPEDKGGE